MARRRIDSGGDGDEAGDVLDQDRAALRLDDAVGSPGTKQALDSCEGETSGLAPLTVGNVTISGTNRTQFSVSSNCGTTLAAGKSCTLTVTFAPPARTARGTKTATLNVRDNSNGVNNSTQSTALTGTAQ